MPRPLIDALDSGLELGDLEQSPFERFTYKFLKLLAEDFSDENYIGRTQFCKLYRGRIPRGWNPGMQGQQHVTVKIWADSLYPEDRSHVNFADKFLRLKDEVRFLSDPVIWDHPNSVKLMGWCCEDDLLGVVYDLNSLDTLRNLISGDSLKWVDRIKIALGLASFLKVLHNHQPQYFVRNISAAHIMLDQDFNPILLDFGMLSSKVSVPGDRGYFPLGAYGYIDPVIALVGWSDITDVFCFGVILMELLGKRTTDGEENLEPTTRGRKVFSFKGSDELYATLKNANGGSPSGVLVHKSLTEDADFDAHDGAMLTMLALECTVTSTDRPRVVEIITRLKDLHFISNRLGV